MNSWISLLSSLLCFFLILWALKWQRKYKALDLIKQAKRRSFTEQSQQAVRDWVKKQGKISREQELREMLRFLGDPREPIDIVSSQVFAAVFGFLTMIAVVIAAVWFADIPVWTIPFGVLIACVQGFLQYQKPVKMLRLRAQQHRNQIQQELPRFGLDIINFLTNGMTLYNALKEASYHVGPALTETAKELRANLEDGPDQALEWLGNHLPQARNLTNSLRQIAHVDLARGEQILRMQFDYMNQMQDEMVQSKIEGAPLRIMVLNLQLTGIGFIMVSLLTITAFMG